MRAATRRWRLRSQRHKNRDWAVDPSDTSAQVSAVRALLRALAVAHPGQPVTVTFAGGVSPPFSMHFAVGPPGGEVRAAGAAVSRPAASAARRASADRSSGQPGR